jgi:hypothetical protein
MMELQGMKKTRAFKMLKILYFINDRFSKVQGENLGRFTYEYNPCYGFVYGTTGCSDGQAAACQNDDVDPNAQYSCGKMSTETFILNAGTQNNELKYTAGDDGRDTTVELVCDESADTPILNALDDYPDYFKYKFKLTTKCACPGLCEGGGGGGGDGPVGEIGLVLIILAFGGLVGYFVVGALVMKFKFEKSGVEMIPNYKFWKDLPFLIKVFRLLLVAEIIIILHMIIGWVFVHIPFYSWSIWKKK